VNESERKSESIWHYGRMERNSVLHVRLVYKNENKFMHTKYFFISFTLIPLSTLVTFPNTYNTQPSAFTLILQELTPFLHCVLEHTSVSHALT